MIKVPLNTETFAAAVPPKLTVAPVRNPEPVILIDVPPLAGPELGEIELTVGFGFPGAVYVKPLLNLPFCVSLLVTITSTAPAVFAAVMAVIDVPLTTFTLVASVPPKLTVAPD